MVQLYPFLMPQCCICRLLQLEFTRVSTEHVGDIGHCIPLHSAALSECHAKCGIQRFVFKGRPNEPLHFQDRTGRGQLCCDVRRGSKTIVFSISVTGLLFLLNFLGTPRSVRHEVDGWGGGRASTLLHSF